MTNKEIRTLEKRASKNERDARREERKEKAASKFDKFKRCTLATIELYR